MSERTRSRRSVLQALGIAGTGAVTLGSLASTSGASSESETDDPDAVPSGWPSYHFDAGNTGYNPDGVGLDDPLYRWRTELDRDASGPVVGDECVFTVQSGPTVTALDPDSGTVRWLESVDGEVDRFRDETALALADGTLFAALGDCVYAFDATDGATLWSDHFDAELSTPTVANGSVYVALANGAFLALDAASGEERWRVADGVGSVSMHNDARKAPAVSPDGSAVHFAADEALYALDAADGTERWRVDVSSYMAPVADDALYVTCTDGVRAYAPSDGSLLWERTFERDVDTTPTVADGRVFVHHYPRCVRALDADTGETEWTVDLELPDRRTTLVADGDHLYVSVQSTVQEGAGVLDEIVALDPTDGTEEWRFSRRYVDTTGSEPVRPVVAEDAVYAVIDDDELYRIDERPADVSWRAEVGDEPDRTAVAGDGVVYAASTAGDDGAVAAFDPETGDRRWTVEAAVVGRPDANEDHCVYAQFGELTALDQADGSVAWRAPLDGEPRTDVCIDDGMAYLGTTNDGGVLYAIDVADGSERWAVGNGRCEPSIAVGPTAPVVAGGTLFADVDGKLTGYDAADGTEQWTRDQNVYALTGGPDVAVVSWQGTVRAVAPDGTVKWTRELSDDVTGLQTVRSAGDGSTAKDGSDGVVVARTVGSPSSHYEALSLADGSSLWEFSVEDGPLSMPTAADGVAYAGTAGGRLYGLDPETGEVETACDAFHGLHDRPAIADGTVAVPSHEGFVYAFETR